MTHPTIDQLTDHLLGAAAEPAQREVRSHLDSGCNRCVRLFENLAQVRRVGKADADSRPPDAAVRTVKALSGFARSRRRSRLVKMRLSFDSLLSPSQDASAVTADSMVPTRPTKGAVAPIVARLERPRHLSGGRYGNLTGPAQGMTDAPVFAAFQPLRPEECPSVGS